MSRNDDVKDVIAMLKDTGIQGCITGSCLLDADFDAWDSEPDVDVFCYSQEAFVHAATLLLESRGFCLGEHGRANQDAERWKLERTIKRGFDHKSRLVTCKMNNGRVTVNVTWRKGQRSVLDVVSAFDMTMVMHGIDIPTGLDVDLRRTIPCSSPRVAEPNPFRSQDVDAYTTAQWVRQFDRVVKYWNRGFDTRPMARFYLKMIDGVIEKGCLFTTDKAVEYFDEWKEEHVEVRQRIAEWLRDKEDC